MMTQNSVTESQEKTLYWVIKGFTLSIAAGFFLFSFILIVWNLHQLLTFSKTEGVIASISVRQTTDKTPSKFYDLSVGFQASGRKIYTQAGTSIFYSPYDKGDRALIYYDPQKPEVAFVNTFTTICFVPTILLLIGLIPLIISNPNEQDFKIIYQKVFG